MLLFLLLAALSKPDQPADNVQLSLLLRTCHPAQIATGIKNRHIWVLRIGIGDNHTHRGTVLSHRIDGRIPRRLTNPQLGQAAAGRRDEGDMVESW